MVVSGSLARYEPFGGYRTQPAAAVNPGITDRGFTGHKGNNTGTYDLDLIYMNARYYLSEIGRFISTDTIVLDPQDPQTYNRYTYALNNPIRNVDPDGHCPRLADNMGSVICFALFIAPEQIQAGPFTVHGDRRFLAISEISLKSKEGDPYLHCK